MGGSLCPTALYPTGLCPRGLYPSIRGLTEPEICYPLTFSFRENITQIEMGQDDSRDVDIIILGDGTGIDLTLADITFVMKSSLGSTRYEIPCRKGSIYKGNLIPASSGGITIPIRTTHSKVSGVFLGELKISFSRGQKTVPLLNYIVVKIKESL